MTDRVSVNPSIHFGKPSVAGTRIPVQNVLELVREGTSFPEIVRDYYPDLQPEDIRACVQVCPRAENSGGGSPEPPPHSAEPPSEKPGNDSMSRAARRRTGKPGYLLLRARYSEALRPDVLQNLYREIRILSTAGRLCAAKRTPLLVLRVPQQLPQLVVRVDG